MCKWWQKTNLQPGATENFSSRTKWHTITNTCDTGKEDEWEREAGRQKEMRGTEALLQSTPHLLISSLAGGRESKKERERFSLCQFLLQLQWQKEGGLEKWYFRNLKSSANVCDWEAEEEKASQHVMHLQTDSKWKKQATTERDVVSASVAVSNLKYVDIAALRQICVLMYTHSCECMDHDREKAELIKRWWQQQCVCYTFWRLGLAVRGEWGGG